MINVILSTPLILDSGTYRVQELSLPEAKLWVKNNNPTNYCGHQTVKILNIQPSTDRAVCERYDSALAVKPKGRLEFGKEYSAEQIIDIGVEILIIERI